MFDYDVIKRRLNFVADSELLVDGKPVARFDIGRYPMVGQRLAMMITFREGTSGVTFASHRVAYSMEYR